MIWIAYNRGWEQTDVLKSPALFHLIENSNMSFHDSLPESSTYNLQGDIKEIRTIPKDTQGEERHLGVLYCNQFQYITIRTELKLEENPIIFFGPLKVLIEIKKFKE